MILGGAVVMAQQCPGDCDGSHDVTVNELLLIVNIALDNANVSTCTAGDLNHDGEITWGELSAQVAAVAKLFGNKPVQ